MKYLAVIHGFNEPDNNTPADEIWAQVVEVKDEHEKDTGGEDLLRRFSGGLFCRGSGVRPVATL